MEVLNGRDHRVQLIEQLLKLNFVVVSLRANYPGLNKDNETVRNIIGVMDELIRSELEIKQHSFLNQGEGHVYLYVINSTDPILIKHKMIYIENNHSLGRLVDIDVYYKDLLGISRSRLNEPRRKCFLCESDAFYCIRNKSHSQIELIQSINEVVKKYERSPS